MNYDEYLMHLNRQFDESKVKRDKGGRFAKKAESRVDKKKRLGGFYDGNSKPFANNTAGNNKQTTRDLLGGGSASAVKNAKKRARNEKIGNIISRIPGFKDEPTGVAAAVKTAKKRARNERISRAVDKIPGVSTDKRVVGSDGRVIAEYKNGKRVKDPMIQQWKQQKNKNTKQKIASAFASARTGKDKASKKINAIKSKFGSYIDKLKGGTEQNLLNKGAASAVKRAKTKVTIKEAIKNAKGKFKEYAARGSAYLGRVRGAAYGAKPYVDKAIDNAKAAAKSGASKAYDTARQVGMNARDEASKIGKKVKSAAIDSLLKSETGRKALDAEYEVEKKVDHAKRMATAKRDYRSIAKKLAETTSIAKVNSSEAREELLVDLTNKALNEYRSKPGSYADNQFSYNDFEALVEETRKTLENTIDKRLSDRKKKTN